MLKIGLSVENHDRHDFLGRMRGVLGRVVFLKTDRGLNPRSDAAVESHSEGNDFLDCAVLDCGRKSCRGMICGRKPCHSRLPP